MPRGRDGHSATLHPGRSGGLAAPAVLAVLAVLLLGGCGSSGSSDASAGSSSGAPAGLTADAAVGSGSGGSDASGSGSGGSAMPAASKQVGATGTVANRILPFDRDLVFTADLTVRVRDVAAAATAAENLADAKQALVFGEETSSDPASPADSRTVMTLRVPPEQFRPLLDGLARLGTRLSQTQTSQDVTAQVADVGSRVATQRRSVEQVRELLGKATSIGDILKIEGELTRRESDLESLEAQQRKLADQTALATVTATFVGTDATPADSTRDLGFLPGLRGGWDAFTASLAVALTALGAVVPFVLVASVVAWPVWAVVRRWRRRPAPAEPAAP